jgi:excisionase family DNA binding protein
VGEVAAMLRVAKNCIYEAVARGDIASVKVGRLVRIPARPFHEKFGEMNPEGEEADPPT